MRYLTVLLLLCYTGAKAQIITGKVLTDGTNKPLVATISTHSGHQTSSNSDGEFTITVSGVTDTLKVFAIGYKPYVMPLRKLKPGPVTIHLKQTAIELKGVAIQAVRDHKKDSIALRREYAKVFNYQSPKLKDAFVSPPSDVPFAFATINLLSIFNTVTKKSDPIYKLQQILLKDEQADYINTRYNRTLIARVTNLKGDSLNTFWDKYYPTVAWVKKASDYDMIEYIKAKLLDFKKDH